MSDKLPIELVYERVQQLQQENERLKKRDAILQCYEAIGDKSLGYFLNLEQQIADLTAKLEVAEQRAANYKDIRDTLTAKLEAAELAANEHAKRGDRHYDRIRTLESLLRDIDDADWYGEMPCEPNCGATFSCKHCLIQQRIHAVLPKTEVKP